MNLKPLLEILKQEYVVHQKMLKAKKQEQRLLVSVNPNELLQNTETIEQWVAEAQQLEQERQTITEHLVREIGLQQDQPTLSDLIEALPSEIRSELEERGDLLRQTVLQLKELNRANSQMLRQSVKTLNWELSQIVNTEESGVYKSNGKKGSSPVPRAGLNVRV